jgi:hypothetical protein
VGKAEQNKAEKIVTQTFRFSFGNIGRNCKRFFCRREEFFLPVEYFFLKFSEIYERIRLAASR